MVWFGVPDCLVFMCQGPPVLLVAGVSIAAVSCIVALMVKTLSMS
jgi:hypothetical protein